MTLKTSSHAMPFGTRVLDDGRVNFRLWAPGANKVELCLQGNAPEIELHMAVEDDGWFGITTELAASGFYYQYRINGRHYVPDPASRFQPNDVHGSSQIIDPNTWQWHDAAWTGRPWEEVVLYELHVGTFSEEGNFAGVKKRLDYLADLGVTAIELMPIADFSGQHNWGYDGVLPFAPDSAYGTPGALKDLVDTAHAKGLMVFNDVVYNHFGPNGNYLNRYAPAFFHADLHTPWGQAINFDHPWVRRFFIHNVLYWLEEYHFDGLRFDAVDAIVDNRSPSFLEELAEAARQGPGYNRPVYLILENDANSAGLLERQPDRSKQRFDAQWNDDLHHALHVLLTGETFSYYQDYRDQPIKHLGRCLTEGFAYQGGRSSYREGKSRGEPSGHLPPTAFVAFLQNHDLIGNRPISQRITDLCSEEAARAATAIILLSPSPPMLFMGQEWACSRPFNFFVDFPGSLAKKVTVGRRKDFARFPEHFSAKLLKKMAPPNDPDTFQNCILSWHEIHSTPHQEWLDYHKKLLTIRHREITPRLIDMPGGQASYRLLSDRTIEVQWTMRDRSTLIMTANLDDQQTTVDTSPQGTLLFCTSDEMTKKLSRGQLDAWSVSFYLNR